MKNIFVQLLMSGLLVSLTACSSDSDSSSGETTKTVATSLEVFAESSQSTAVGVDITTSTWLSDCYLDGTQNKYAQDYISFQDIDGPRIGIYKYVYSDPSDSTCALSFTSTQVVGSTTVAVNGTKSIVEWFDGYGGATVPTRADGAGELTAQPTVSRLDLGTPRTTIVYIDETATPWVMYRSSLTLANGTDGYPDVLLSYRPLTKI